MARKASTTKATDATTPVTATVQSGSAAEMMKKPELLDEVVLRTNLKKRDVKPAIEAAFAIIAEALRDGRDLNMPPLGKVRLVKTKALDAGASVMTLKLRTPKNASLAAPAATPDSMD